MSKAKKNKASKPGPKKDFIMKTSRADLSNFVETAGSAGGTEANMAAAISAMTQVTTEEKRQLVAEAAYYRAERRSFAPGYELEDWLDAEAEIDTMLSKSV